MNLKSLISLWNHTQKHPGTSGARACAGVLLGLYNGSRFPFDLTELRLLDGHLLAAALEVIAGDARQCKMEVHEWLNLAGKTHNFGARFEWLASDYKCFKRGAMSLKALRENYGSLRPVLMLIEESGNRAIPFQGEPRYTASFNEPRGLGAQLHAKFFPVSGAADAIPNRSDERRFAVVADPIKGLSYDQLTTDGLRLTPEQAAAVQAMCDELPARTNQPIDSTHFDNLAG